MKNIPEYVEELEEYGELHNKECGVLQEEECDCDMGGIKTLFTTTLTQLQKDTKEQMRKEFVERIEGMKKTGIKEELTLEAGTVESYEMCVKYMTPTIYNQALTDIISSLKEDDV